MDELSNAILSSVNKAIDEVIKELEKEIKKSNAIQDKNKKQNNTKQKDILNMLFYF